MRTNQFSRNAVRSLIAAACALSCLAAEAATIRIQSRDAAGVGFNDPTPVAPIGGNPGTTLGQQRFNVYRAVADIWERNLNSNVEIVVSAAWENLTCTATSATLGSASAWNIWHDFPGGKPGTWYPQALANKLAGTNLSAGQPDTTGYDNVDIKTQFNARLGQPGCLEGSPFYLGLDGNAGSQVNFAATLLHELGHGLGFSVTSVNTSNGYRIIAAGTAYVATGGLPSVWEEFMYDNTAQKSWLNMTSNERRLSAINPLQLAWTGPNAVAGAAVTLAPLPIVKATGPTGNLPVSLYSASPFGPTPVPGKLGALATVASQEGELGNACSPFNAANAAAVRGKVAIIDRGGCNFTVKVINAQEAGAVAAILVNNVACTFTPGGADPAVRIPSVGVTMQDGAALKAAVNNAVKYGTRNAPGTVIASLATDPTRKAGADLAGRPLLYTPNPLIGGSSVSHWDVSAFPNLLMEPNISADLTLQVSPPKDLTLPLLKDLGW